MFRRPVAALSVTALVLAASSPLHALQQDSSAARVVITIDSLDRAAFANVAELLQARVPGLHVARTGEGGMRWFMRGPASFAESAPMVLIDDMPINMAGSAMRDIGTRPPMLDEIDIEDVDRIEVLSGPATAIRYGTGAGNGVIRIVTFAPRAQQTSFRIAASATALDENVTYPTNAFRAGIDTAGAPVRTCRLQEEANGVCTPVGPPTLINVLESDSPFETAMAARVAAAIASGNERLAWRGGASFDRQGSTSGTLTAQRAHVRGAAALRVNDQADAAVHAHWTRGDADLPGTYEQSLLRQGLFARADTAWRGFVRPRSSPYGSRRYGLTMNGRWRPRAWLAANLTGGVARMTDENDLEYTVLEGFSARSIDIRGERRLRDGNVRLDAEARYGVGRLSQSTAVTIEHGVSKHEEEFSEFQTTVAGVGSRGFWINRRTAIAGVGLMQQWHLRQSLELAGGVRLDQVRVDGVRWDVPVSPHLSLSWDARAFVPDALGTLRVRAALGDVANVPQTTRIAFAVTFGDPDRPKAEVTRERELGFDATLLQNRVEASFTWYTKRTSSVGAVVLSGPPASRFERFEVLNRGLEASLRARILQRSRVTWDTRVWYAYNHNEVTRGTGGIADLAERSFGGPSFFYSPQWIIAGQPLGAHRRQPIISVRDLDGDGLVDDACYDNTTPCEVVVRLAGEFQPAYPPTSASVETSFRFGMLTLSALLDRRSGHAMNNVTMQERCRWFCQALYDPSTSLRDQAEAVLAWGSGGTTVEDASYTRLREISLRVEAPVSWARALGASRLDVSLAGRNVATWTDYSGLDPEATSAAWAPLANFDYAAIPLPRRFTIRVDLHGHGRR